MKKLIIPAFFASLAGIATLVTAFIHKHKAI